MYFIRLIMSYVHEGLNIIDEINRSHDLRAAVERCDERTRENFWNPAILTSRDRGHLSKFRTKATFHYDKTVPGEHLKRVIGDSRWRALRQGAACLRPSSGLL